MKTNFQEVVVVGGGIAGLYCCYHLARAGKRVRLYEASHRLGGRIESCTFDDELYADFGPMRIEPACQALLGALMDKLEFQTAPIEKAKTGDLVEFSEYRSEEPVDFMPKRSGEEGEHKDALDVLKNGLLTVCLGTKRSLWNKSACEQFKLMTYRHPDVSRMAKRFDEWLPTLTNKDFDNLRRSGEFSGTPLWNMGFWNVLSDVLPHHEITRMRDFGTFYHILGENPNAAEWMVFWLRALQTSPHLRGLKGGMEQIVQRFEKLLRTDPELHGNIEFHFGMKLVGLKPTATKRIRLTFSQKDGKPPIHTNAEQVILALPKRPLEHLAHDLTPIREHIDSVIGFPLVKCFFVIDDPWWEKNRPANRFASVVPTRELHYWTRKDKRRGVIMVYADRPASEFWADYFPRMPAEQYKALRKKGKAKNARLVEKFEQYVYANGVTPKMYKSKNMREYGIRDWSREPFGAGAHAWRPGRKSWEVMDRLEQFSLAPAGGIPNMHICGEAYSDYQGFIEGALRSADNVLSKLGVKRKGAF